MPNLSDLVPGKVPDYLEFAWVTTPAAAGQTIPTNFITVLSCTDIVQNTNNLADVSITANSRFTIPGGTYYFEATCPMTIQAYQRQTAVLGLYNFTDSVWVSRGKKDNHNAYTFICSWNGQFKTTASKAFDLRIYARNNLNSAFTVWNGGADNTGNEGFTTGVSTNSIDQRTTIKLWKLK